MITDLEPEILECEVKWVLNKASGGDGIPVKLFQILKGDAVKLLLPDNAPVAIVRNVEEFGLYDGERLLLPERDWRVVRAPARGELEITDLNRLPR